MMVHSVITATGVLGVICSVMEHDFHAGAALAVLLVVVGVVGVVRRPESVGILGEGRGNVDG